MTELSYSKSFLSTLAQRPIRLSPDYVEDPRKLPARTPYTLPRSHPDKIKRQRIPASTNATVTLTLKPLRPNPALMPLSLPSTPLSTTIATLKHKYSTSLPVRGTEPAKLKLLLKGKPLADVKTLSELGFKDGDEVTITVMLMGGGNSAVPAPVVSPPPPTPAPEVRMADVTKTKALAQDGFWKELRAFLEEKLARDDVEEDPGKVLQVFREAWKE